MRRSCVRIVASEMFTKYRMFLFLVPRHMFPNYQIRCDFTKEISNDFNSTH